MSGQNSKFFTVLGAVFPHFLPDKREIWHGGPLPVPNFTFIGATCRSIFGPLSKNNTGMAALRTGLSVIKSYNHRQRSSAALL